jgi:hypothetical protein
MSAISTKIYAKDSSGTLRELQPETTISNVSGLQTALDGKVNTESGKGLSTNDYTTTEKNKLAGIANNANNYVHPTTSGNKHIPSGGSSGKLLGWSADGTAAWIDEPSKGTVTSVKVGSTSYSPSSGVVSLPAYPTTLPASDVYSWAKASSKPSYNADEISATGTTNLFVTSTEKSTWNGKGTYSKPSGGIPKTDLASAVQTSLGKADTALQSETYKGTVTSVNVGTTSYSPSSGVVSLPQFITYGTVGSFTGSLASLVVRDGSFVLKGSVFYVANVFFTTISNVSANTEITLATVDVKPKYDTKTTITISKNDNSSVLTDSAVLQIKADGSVTLKSPVAIGSGSNAGRINDARVIDLSI